jgi:hypothetical protein
VHKRQRERLGQPACVGGQYLCVTHFPSVKRFDCNCIRYQWMVNKKCFFFHFIQFCCFVLHFEIEEKSFDYLATACLVLFVVC